MVMLMPPINQILPTPRMVMHTIQQIILAVIIQLTTTTIMVTMIAQVPAENTSNICMQVTETS
jgi:hypothetical protein